MYRSCLHHCDFTLIHDSLEAITHSSFWWASLKGYIDHCIIIITMLILIFESKSRLIQLNCWAHQSVIQIDFFQFIQVYEEKKSQDSRNSSKGNIHYTMNDISLHQEHLNYATINGQMNLFTKSFGLQLSLFTDEISMHIREHHKMKQFIYFFLLNRLFLH